MIKIAAANFDKDGNVLEASSIITTAKYNRLISVYFDENGELRNKSGLVTTANFSKLFAEGVTSNGLVKKAELNVYVTKDEFGDLVSGVTIKADQIKLEGLVTANSYFKVLTDGSIETRNANINGSVKVCVCFFVFIRRVSRSLPLPRRGRCRIAVSAFRHPALPSAGT